MKTIIEEPVTLEKLKSFDNFNEAIEWAQNKYKSSTAKYPKKPVLPKEPTPQQAREYADAMEAYPKLLSEHQKSSAEANAFNSPITETIEQYVKHKGGLDRVPVNKRDKVWAKAWEEGHAHGYSEILNCLYGLVELFED